MHEKIDLQKRSRKGCSKDDPPDYPPVPKWRHFPSKIDEKIDAKIDAEKVMKIDEKSMRK